MIGMGSGPACYGEGKLYWAEKWAEEQGLSMDEAAGMPITGAIEGLLQRVGHAVVVHPKDDCFALARQRGWTSSNRAGLSAPWDAADGLQGDKT